MHCPSVVRSRIGGREMEQYTPYKSWFPLNVTTASLLVTRKEAESGTAEQTEKESRLGYKNSKRRIISSQRAKSQLSRRLLQGTCPFGNAACSEFAFQSGNLIKFYKHICQIFLILQQVIILPLSFTIRSLTSSSTSPQKIKIAYLNSFLFDYRTMKISTCIF